MNSSPKKHRGTFRPVNTLASPQKPQYSTTHGSSKAPSGRLSQAPPLHISLIDDSEESLSDSEYNPESVAHRVEHLGNSSSLFDDNESKENSTVMVREREPPSLPGQPQPRKEAAFPKPLQDLTNTPPEFGKASPIRNPLRKEQSKEHSNIFNIPKPGQRRPEHHRTDAQRPAPPTFSNPSTAPINQQGPLSNVGRQPAPTMNTGARLSTASSAGSDIVEITSTQFQPRQPSQGFYMPSNPPMRTIQPAPRPVYSSMGHANGFQPINQGFNSIKPWQPSRQTIILPDPVSKRATADDEDDFDPDAAIRAESNQFGAPDRYAYVDQSKANENIKALLEGAFDEDEERIPRTRGRKKTKQQQVEAANSLAAKLQALEVKDAEAKDDAEDQEDEEDDGTVDGLKVKLLPHQVDGVAWMIEKETGAHNKRGKLPKGGILADDMGLGKTIQSIAVLLSNPRPEKDAVPENKKNKIAPTVSKGTLIVAPLALIKQWESEINTKVSSSHSLKVLVHHGTNRTKSSDKLKTYDVVITTYQVLASEHASCGDGPDGLKKGCFAVHWYRVILDEAHTIKNRNAKMTKACYDIRSHYRWCLTGTPMQNNLDELQSLIKFLRIQPYSEMSNWKESITGPMKNGRGNLAMRRLQIFLKAFMKRRTKDVLKKEGALNFGGKPKEGEDKPAFQIVARNIETVIGEFTVKERAFYERLSDRAESRLAEMMGAEKTDYIGALVLLLRLRQACNHPNLTKSNVKDDKDALTTEKKVGASGLQTPRKGGQDADADDLADLLGGLSVATKRCDICQLALSRDNAAPGAIRCNDCEDDLNVSQKKKKSKKNRKDRKPKDAKKKHHKATEPAHAKKSRSRRVVVDSDDEDEGEWIVSNSEQKNIDLGRAGGTDDEDAEGGGDTLGSGDSDSFASEDEGTPSKKRQNDSFIVHDTDSEEEGPVIRKQQLKTKKTKVISLVSEDESDSESTSELDSEDSNSEESDSETRSEESDTEDSEIEYNASELTPSTKIRQLLAILEKETPDHKVIVFSQFTSMLDLIEPFLQREGYNFTRYDGKMRNDLREASLHKLRNDKRTRVLLCSLKCGSLGLNLTAASRVVIMEPFWNPFVEEQAIDRVHRLNQTVDVTVYRLSIHNSVEERILELQEAKRKLAEAAIEGGKAVGKLSMKDILALFKHDAEYDHRNVDDGADHTIFNRTRVLESPVKVGVTGHVDKGITMLLEKAEPVVKRKAGSLGLKALRKVEDSVWGRR